MLLTVILTLCVANLATTTTTPCPESWSRLGDKCYRYSGQTHYGPASAAAEQCRLAHDGATPVTVHDAEVNSFLASLIPLYPAWLAISRSNTTDWAWADGSATDYFNWIDGFPLEGDNCAVIGSSMVEGQWGSDQCEDVWPFLCQLQW